jgi:hypothetical protein
MTMEAQVESHHRRHRCAPGALKQTVGVVEIEAKWFFDEKVAACVQDRQCDLGMRPGWHAHRYRVDLGISEQSFGIEVAALNGEPVAHQAQALGIAVGDRHGADGWN